MLLKEKKSTICKGEVVDELGIDALAGIVQGWFDLK